jgi:hypothetical protein
MKGLRARNWRLLVLDAAIFLVLSLFASRRFLFTGSNHFPGGVYQQIPDSYGALAGVMEWKLMLQQGIMPLGESWNPRVEMGAPGISFPSVDMSVLFSLFMVTGDALLSYKISIFLAYFLACLSMMRLAYSYTRSHGASLVSSVAYSFAAYRVVEIDFGHPSMVWGFVVLPLVVLQLERTLRSPSLRDALVASLLFAIMSRTDLQQTLFVCFFVVLRLVVEVARLTVERAWASLKRVLLAVSFSVALALYLVAPSFLSDLLFGPSEGSGGLPDVRPIEVISQFSVDPSSFFLRGWNEVARQPQLLYLGLAVVALSCIALASLRSAVMRRDEDLSGRMAFYALAGVFFMVVDLGTSSRLFGFEFRVFSLWNLIYSLVPLVRFVRAIYRATVIVNLSLALLAGFGALYLLRRLESHRDVPTTTGVQLRRSALSVLPKALPLLLVALVFLDSSYGLEAGVSSLILPTQLYDYVKSQPGDFRISEIPTNPYSGANSTIYAIQWLGSPCVKPVVTRSMEVAVQNSTDIGTASALMGVRYVLVNRSPDSQAVESALRSSGDFRLVARDEAAALYENLRFMGMAFLLKGNVSDLGSISTAPGYAEYYRPNANTIVIRVNSPEESTLIVSEAYSKGWELKAPTGLAIKDRFGVMSVDLQPGYYELTLHYSRYERSLLLLTAYYSLLLVAVLLLTRPGVREKLRMGGWSVSTRLLVVLLSGAVILLVVLPVIFPSSVTGYSKEFGSITPEGRVTVELEIRGLVVHLAPPGILGMWLGTLMLLAFSLLSFRRHFAWKLPSMESIALSFAVLAVLIQSQLSAKGFSLFALPENVDEFSVLVTATLASLFLMIYQNWRLREGVTVRPHLSRLARVLPRMDVSSLPASYSKARWLVAVSAFMVAVLALAPVLLPRSAGEVYRQTGVKENETILFAEPAFAGYRLYLSPVGEPLMLASATVLIALSALSIASRFRRELLSTQNVAPCAAAVMLYVRCRGLVQGYVFAGVNPLENELLLWIIAVVAITSTTMVQALRGPIVLRRRPTILQFLKDPPLYLPAAAVVLLTTAINILGAPTKVGTVRYPGVVLALADWAFLSLLALVAFYLVRIVVLRFSSYPKTSKP